MEEGFGSWDGQHATQSNAFWIDSALSAEILLQIAAIGFLETELLKLDGQSISPIGAVQTTADASSRV
jgi:hypothetical protein